MEVSGQKIMDGVGSTILILVAILAASCTASRSPSSSQQNPSPMEDHTRAHERIVPEPLEGTTVWLQDFLSEKVSVFVPHSVRKSGTEGMLIHFHGSAFVVNMAVARSKRRLVGVNVNLGSGSSVYERPFQDESAIRSLLDGVRNALSELGLDTRDATIYLSAFSAGYGAVRAILRSDADLVDGILLLDGLHTGYIPDGVVLSSGGVLESAKMDSFLEFAKMAARGEKRFVITHSEIFPGTYASTTETSDYLIKALGLERKPVLEWGPGGMQMLSRTEVGRLTILGFAGNTAPDHVDHFHGLPEFLMTLVGD